MAQATEETAGSASPKGSSVRKGAYDAPTFAEPMTSGTPAVRREACGMQPDGGRRAEKPLDAVSGATMQMLESRPAGGDVEKQKRTDAIFIAVVVLLVVIAAVAWKLLS